jgi:hypothetical protein
MNEIRTAIFANDHMANSIPGYKELEVRMRNLLGYTDRVSWLTIKEILTCHDAHDIAFPEGITHEDKDQVSHLAGWMWGTLYKNDALNKLAIGRFLREMVDVLRPAVIASAGQSDNHNDDDDAKKMLQLVNGDLKTFPKMLFYSGHDSTLVPVLCALGIYDGELRMNLIDSS